MCDHIECPYRKRCKFSPDYDPEYESDGYWKSIFGWILPEDSDEVEGCFAYLDNYIFSKENKLWKTIKKYNLSRFKYFINFIMGSNRILQKS